MLTLYYTPGACSMAAHIVLEESGEEYEAKKVDLAGGEQRTEAYLKINPLGRVPALLLDNGEPLAENTAILPFLGKRFDLWPEDAVAEAKALAVERAALEGQGAGIRLLDFYSRVGVAPDRFLDKDRRIFNRGNLAEVGSPGEREG
jgi:glutathione S-transferase